ncbi:flagellar assembly protein FliH [Lentibacillus persicus]|uniref:Flagellar assembly protein FliH n=1 Tax=Lentibacillus persicus TaxID=640948 RepID=A0A1I1VD22_9BACI|nr:flagellar assembly protein FliH [Lentibacillus persicus]SFD80655.1 flagellar assembly protein FliH [Lentibacillus persicus]
MSNIDSSQPEYFETRQISIRPINVTSSEQDNDLEEQKLKKPDIDKAYEELQQIKEEQAELINQTRAEIKEARSNWGKEKKQYIEEAKKEGFEAGFQEGKQNGFKQYEQLIAEANSAVKSAGEDYQTLINQSENTILDLAIYTAEKILKGKLDEQPEQFLPLVKSAIEEIHNKSEVSIYLHPSNYQVVTTHKNDLIQFDDSEWKISIYVSDELSEGSCLIVHPYGQIDAGIDTQLNELRQALHEAIMGNAQ